MYTALRFASERTNDLHRSAKQRTLNAYPDREWRPRQQKHWANR